MTMPLHAGLVSLPITPSVESPPPVPEGGEVAAFRDVLALAMGETARARSVRRPTPAAPAHDTVVDATGSERPAMVSEGDNDAAAMATASARPVPASLSLPDAGQQVATPVPTAGLTPIAPRVADDAGQELLEGTSGDAAHIAHAARPAIRTAAAVEEAAEGVPDEHDHAEEFAEFAPPTLDGLVVPVFPRLVPPVAAATTVRQDSLEPLVPEFRGRLERVIDRMEEEFGVRVEVVETVRSQERQDALFAQGRTMPGPVVTWTRASRHAHGLAADVTVNGGWSDRTAFERLAVVAREEGLRTLGPRDPGHIELPVAPYAAPQVALDGDAVPRARTQSFVSPDTVPEPLPGGQTRLASRPSQELSVPQRDLLPWTRGTADPALNQLLVDGAAREATRNHTDEVARRVSRDILAGVPMTRQTLPDMRDAAAVMEDVERSLPEFGHDGDGPVATWRRHEAAPALPLRAAATPSPLALAQPAAVATVARVAPVATVARVATVSSAANHDAQHRASDDASGRASLSPALAFVVDAPRPVAWPTVDLPAELRDPVLPTLPATLADHEREAELSGGAMPFPTAERAPATSDAPFEALLNAPGDRPASEPTLAVREVERTDTTERIARVLRLQEAASDRPVSSLTLRLEHPTGGEDRIRIDLRGGSIGTTFDVQDRGAADQLRLHAHELQEALERRGLDAERVLVRSSPELPAFAAAQAGERDSVRAALASGASQGPGGQARDPRAPREQPAGQPSREHDNPNPRQRRDQGGRRS